MKARKKKRNRFWAWGLGALLMLTAAVCFLKSDAAVWTVTDGSRVTVHTATKTDPEEILARQGIALGADDSYSVRRAEGGWEIRIIRGDKPHQIQEEIQQYAVVMQPEVIRYADPSLPQGLEIVLREGSYGELRCTALVTYVNGIETGKKVLEEKVRIQPVSRIIAVGTAAAEKGGGEPVIKDGLIYLPSGEVLTYDRVITSLATAYCDKGLTATGTQARVGAIAVDPRVIPYGTRVFIVSKDGEYVYGPATAEDCGSKEHIYDTRIDLHFDTYAECRQFGVRYCRVYFLS